MVRICQSCYRGGKCRFVQICRDRPRELFHAMSMGKAPPRSVSLPKLERKLSQGLALSSAELKSMRKAAPLAAVH